MRRFTCGYARLTNSCVVSGSRSFDCGSRGCGSVGECCVLDASVLGGLRLDVPDRFRLGDMLCSFVGGFGTGGESSMP